MQAAVTYSQDDLKDKTLIFIEQHTEVSDYSLLETYSQNDLKDKPLILIEQHTEVSVNSLLEIG